MAEARGAPSGLRLLDVLEQSGRLPDYHLLPAARAQLLTRVGRHAEAAEAYRRAIALTQNAAERRFLERALSRVTAS